MPVSQYVLSEICKAALNAINTANLTDAEIVPLSGTAEFKRLFIDRPSAPWNRRQDMNQHAETSIDNAIEAGIFTNTNIQAAATVDSVRDLVVVASAGAGQALPRNYQSGGRGW